MLTLREIGVYRSALKSKFGAPKQSGLAPALVGEVEFVGEFAAYAEEALRGIDGYDYLWLLWGFSANAHEAASPVVRPPVLGGNVRMGVFATRSPYRPNPIGLSSVRLLGVERDAERGWLLRVSGADLIDGTPIYDIKPYLPYADAHADARGGFSETVGRSPLHVELAPGIEDAVDADTLEAICEVLSLDPRPQYHTDASRVYGMRFGEYEVKFRVADGVVFLTRVHRIG